MANLFGVFGGMLGKAGSGIVYTIYGLLFILFVVFIISRIRVRMMYRYPVRVYRVRENGKVKEKNYIGGYIGRRNSAPFFRIKTGRLWWQYVDLSETPKPQYLDEDDRVYYKQIDVGTFIQLKRGFPIKSGDEIKFTPVETDVKYGAILSIQRIKDVLRLEPTWKKVLPYAGLIILAVVFIIAYAMLMKNCSAIILPLIL